MADPSTPRRPGARRKSGFSRAAGLVAPQIKAAGASRGFTVSRLLTQWAEVVGPDIAKLCRPVRVSYGKGGLGGTLTLLARGAAGPMLQAQLPLIKDRVNACYGHAAIARIKLTQTDGAAGFAEGQTPFAPPPRRPTGPSPEATDQASALTEEITDPTLRAALSGLGARILARPVKGAPR